MRFRTRVIAASTHKDLQRKINTWIQRFQPQVIRDVKYSVDSGCDYPYSVFILYVPREDD